MPPPSPTTPASQTSYKTAFTAKETNTPDGSPLRIARPKTPLAATRQSTNCSRTSTIGDMSIRINHQAESPDQLSIEDTGRSLRQDNRVTAIKISRSKTLNNKATSSKHSKLDELLPDEVCSVAAVNDPDAQTLNEDTHSLTESTHRQLNSNKRPNDNHVDTDGFASGLPKELYNPRPSRSRSTQIKVDPIDYSKQSEQGMNSKAKRRKTTTDISSNIIHMSIAEKADAIENMGFSPNQTRQALKQSAGNFDVALDQLVAQSGAEKDAVLVSKTRRVTSKSGFVGVEIPPSKYRISSVITHADEQHISNTSNDAGGKPGFPQTNEVDLQVAQCESGRPAEPHVPSTTPRIPSLSPTQVNTRDHSLNEEPIKRSVMKQSQSSRRKSAKRRVAEEASDEQEDFSPYLEEVPQELPKEKKRGRGRPRKVVDPPKKDVPIEDVPIEDVPIEDVPIEDATKTSISSHLNDQDSRAIESLVLQEIVSNALPATLLALTSNQDITAVPTATPPDTSPPATPEPAKISAKSSTDHSPISKSKVPLRVGLSKRTRIAPLLKIIKK
jgi:hypothetical protein